MACALRFSTPAAAPPGQSSWAGLSPIGPRRRSRLQAKEELRRLNDRLAAYIEGVRRREAARAALQRRLGEAEAEARPGGLLRQRYEAELAEVRRLLDDQAARRAALQLELDALRDQHRQLRDRNSKKESDLSLAVAQVRDFHARLQSREADFATALSRQRTLEKALRESEDQMTSLQSMAKDTKTQLQDERLKRIDLENQMQTLREEVMFLKNLHKDELKRRKSFYESKIKETESGHQQEFQNKLLDALQALRQEQEQQIEAYKEQVERKFATQVENAQLSAAKNSDFANSTQEEFQNTKLRLDLLTSQNAALEATTTELEATVRELEKTINSERDAHRRCVAEKHREMAEVRQQMQAQLEEYERLLDVKLALDLEISAYRTMLEREEKRLGLSVSALESAGVHSAASQGRLFLQGKKRKRTPAEKQGAKIGFKEVQHASSSGSISIEEIDVEGRFVRIKNNSDQDQSLSGWTLRREHRNESDTMYQFPTGFTLQAGQKVTVRGLASGQEASCSLGPKFHPYEPRRFQSLARTNVSVEKLAPALSRLLLRWSRIWHASKDLQEVGLTLVWKSQKSWRSGENVNLTLLNAKGEETAERTIAYTERRRGEGVEGEEEEAAKEEEEMELYTQVGSLAEVPKVEKHPMDPSK